MREASSSIQLSQLGDGSKKFKEPVDEEGSAAEDELADARAENEDQGETQLKETQATPS